MTSSSGSGFNSLFNNSNLKGKNTRKLINSNGKSQKKGKYEKERFDWMIKKNDNYFNQY